VSTPDFIICRAALNTLPTSLYAVPLSILALLPLGVVHQAHQRTSMMPCLLSGPACRGIRATCALGQPSLGSCQHVGYL
jgi:hypothetical protein